MKARQNNLCAICGSPPRGKRLSLSLDHNHTTRQTRGLLCVVYNTVVGFVENGGDLEKVLAYLEAWNAKRVEIGMKPTVVKDPEKT